MSAPGSKIYKPQALKVLQETSININWIHRNGEQDSVGKSGWNSSWNGEEMKKNCETKYGVVEEIQNQNGVVVFSNLEDATEVVLVKLGMNNIGYLLHT